MKQASIALPVNEERACFASLKPRVTTLQSGYRDMITSYVIFAALLRFCHFLGIAMCQGQAHRKS
jgi:hypothetical protein